MADDVIHFTQCYIKYINRAILANLQCRTMKFGRLIVLQETFTVPTEQFEASMSSQQNWHMINKSVQMWGDDNNLTISRTTS